MRVYIAAPWVDRANMPEISQRLEARGHLITHKWWEAEDTPEGVRADSVLRQQAINDVAGVKNADIVLVINTAKSEGKSLEQGIAIADNKPIIIVGKLGEHSKNVFHYLDNYRWVYTVDHALEILDTIQWLTSHEEV